ncbi:hypothetical protein LCM20_09185 [Halobacillus litoralis]|uniref:hypothetical protein n=1 Tax=Halobacillus litoralis TaxID=45668 RepID=UPI001CD7DE3A|nr:hypothetical protein [Halobacillus litoralis]MCA0970761.1 hypothetical protein [Halobacillus litoralis]
MKNDQEISEKTHLYLRLLGPRFNRQFVFLIVVLLLGLMGILPLLGVPFSKGYFYAAAVPSFMVLVWGIPQFIAPYRLEKLHHLYLGFSGFALTYIYFLVTQKLIYMHIGATHPGYFITGLLLFSFLLIVMWKVNREYLFEGSYYDPNRSQMSEASAKRIVRASGIGYVMGQVLLSLLVGDSFKMVLYIFIISLMAIFTAFMSTFVQRYWFIHQNLEAIKRLNPEYGLPKKERLPGPKYGYAVFVLVDDQNDQEEVDQLASQVFDNMEEADSVTVLSLDDMDEKERDQLEGAFPNQVLQAPGYVLFEYDYEELKREIKKMEKKHHNGFFKEIPEEEYAKTGQQVAFQPFNAILYTNDLQKLIYKEETAASSR